VKHDLTPAQVDSIIEAHLYKRERQREYQKANWAQINLRLRIGGKDLAQLDKLRGDQTRHSYTLMVLRMHLNQFNHLPNQ
jgi:hypothetical protein